MLNPDSSDAKTEYAFWTDEQSGLRVEYALPLFHEIDFQVNEAYRSIPHGGVEIGGVLWGRRTAGVVTVEAFRQIACEHAAGPSFNLSAADLAGLEMLIASGAKTEELRELEPIGWFIAHTRGPLVMAQREQEWFARYFSEPGKLTVLVKPERFQPTRFGFLLRRKDGTMPVDAAGDAVILPLPGRAGKGVMASIPAPVRKSDGVGLPADVKVQAAVQEEPVDKRKLARVKAVMAETTLASNDRAGVSEPLAKAEPAAADPAVEETTPLRAEKTTQEKAPGELIVMKPAGTPPAPVQPAAEEVRPGPAQAQQLKPVEPPAANSLGGDRFRGIREPALPQYDLAAVTRRRLSAWQVVALLLLAAGLGSALGYWAYLQLPPVTIELRAQKSGNDVIVQWPADQTRDVDYAAYRLNDGPAQLLTLSQRLSGQLTIPAVSSDTKVEVVAQHWLRDAHGFVRLLAAPPAQAGLNTQ